MRHTTQDAVLFTWTGWIKANWRRLAAGGILLLATRLPYLLQWAPEDGTSQLVWLVVRCLLWFAFLLYLVWWLLDRDRAHGRA